MTTWVDTVSENSRDNSLLILPLAKLEMVQMKCRKRENCLSEAPSNVAEPAVRDAAGADRQSLYKKCLDFTTHDYNRHIQPA